MVNATHHRLWSRHGRMTVGLALALTTGACGGGFNLGNAFTSEEADTKALSGESNDAAPAYSVSVTFISDDVDAAFSEGATADDVVLEVDGKRTYTPGKTFYSTLLAAFNIEIRDCASNTLAAATTKVDLKTGVMSSAPTFHLGADTVCSGAIIAAANPVPNALDPDGHLLNAGIYGEIAGNLVGLPDIEKVVIAVEGSVEINLGRIAVASDTQLQLGVSPVRWFANTSVTDAVTNHAGVYRIDNQNRDAFAAQVRRNIFDAITLKLQ